MLGESCMRTSERELCGRIVWGGGRMRRGEGEQEAGENCAREVSKVGGGSWVLRGHSENEGKAI